MDTLLVLVFSVARSCFPSPLKLSTMIAAGAVAPTAKLVAAPNEPVPVPRSTDTVFC